MPLPAVVIAFGSTLLANAARVIGISALKTAFVSGGFRALGKALLIKAGTFAVTYFTVSKSIQLGFSALEYLWRFDWNMSDTAIDTRVQSSLVSLASIAGGALGSTLGMVGCSTGMAFLNPTAFAWAMKDITEEVFEEIAANFQVLLTESVRTAANAAVLLGYKSLRSWLKSSGIATALLGPEKAKKWGDGKVVVSLAKAWEDKIEAIPNTALRAFVEELFEEGYEACKEITLFIAGRFDQFLALSRAGMRSAVLGSNVVLEVTPNRVVDSEPIVLAGREQLVRAQVPSILSTNQLIDNRDIGVMIGGDSYQELSQRRDPRVITVIFEFSTNNQRPFYKPVNGFLGIIKPKITVSNVERSKLNWSRLKLAAGDANGYMYGRWYCLYKLVSAQGANRGTIKAFADTADNAIDRCRAMLELTDSELATFDTNEENIGGNRTRNNSKPTVRIYPYRVTIAVAVDTTMTDEGRRRLNSNRAKFVTRRAVIPLHTELEPVDFPRQIDALFRTYNRG